MGCSYLVSQDVTMQWIFSGELSGHLTLSGLLSTICIVITPGKNCEKLTFLVQLPLTLYGFIHCRELNEKWASLLWKCQLPLCTMYSLQADLCSPLKMSVCLFVLRKSAILREKNESLCCEHVDAKKGWLWSWHLLQNKEQQNEGLYFSCSKIKGQQLEPFIPSERKPGQGAEEVIMETLFFIRWETPQKMHWSCSLSYQTPIFFFFASSTCPLAWYLWSHNTAISPDGWLH